MSTAVQELETTDTGEVAEIIATVLPATSLRNALSACLLAAGSASDCPLPVLQAVHVDKTGDVLTFRGTDRYRLAQVTVKLESAPDGDWQTLISAADVKRIVALLPKTDNRYLGPTIATLAPDAVTLPGAGSMQFTPVDGEYPKTANLITTTTEAVEGIGFNPKYLADLAKMPGFGKNEPAQFKFNGPGKPAVVRWGDDAVSYLYLLMPVRVNS